MQDANPPPPPELAMLMERLKRATDPQERQRAWDDLVSYQRQHGVRAQPRTVPHHKSSRTSQAVCRLWAAAHT